MDTEQIIQPAEKLLQDTRAMVSQAEKIITNDQKVKEESDEKDKRIKYLEDKIRECPIYKEMRCKGYDEEIILEHIQKWSNSIEGI